MSSRKKKPSELEAARKRIARLEGLISRWAGLNGQTPDPTMGETAPDRFEAYLDQAQRDQHEAIAATRAAVAAEMERERTEQLAREATVDTETDQGHNGGHGGDLPPPPDF